MVYFKCFTSTIILQYVHYSQTNPDFGRTFQIAMFTMLTYGRNQVFVVVDSQLYLEDSLAGGW